MSKYLCETCIFWKMHFFNLYYHETPEEQTCHFLPPQHTPVGVKFPVTKKDEGCGQWKRMKKK